MAHFTRHAACLTALLATCAAGLAQPSEKEASPAKVEPTIVVPPLKKMPRPEKPKEPPLVDQKVLDAAVEKGVELLLGMQEGEGPSEWPYEGVYKVREKNKLVIPIGYRIGNTGIVAVSLIAAPGYAKDEKRQAAVARACAFVCKGIEHPLMSYGKDYDGNYDVRGWGHGFGLDFLLAVKKNKIVPKGQEEAVERAATFYLNALHETAMPKSGGWNYARPPGRDTPGNPSPFMTACILQTLFEAKAQGMPVRDEVVNDALAFMVSARASKDGTNVGGPVMYAGSARPNAKVRQSDDVPGATGRMCATEVTLTLAGGGRSSEAHLRAAVEAFIKYWDELDKRRMKDATHLPPYMVAPYYFIYAHRYAAMAVEMLPEAERAGYRKKINELLFGVRSEDGSWNDRVFPRTANFGTAWAMLAIMQPGLGLPARWEGKEKGSGPVQPR